MVESVFGLDLGPAVGIRNPQYLCFYIAALQLLFLVKPLWAGLCSAPAALNARKVCFALFDACHKRVLASKIER